MIVNIQKAYYRKFKMSLDGVEYLVLVRNSLIVKSFVILAHLGKDIDDVSCQTLDETDARIL